jgi:hypothetical protein
VAANREQLAGKDGIFELKSLRPGVDTIQVTFIGYHTATALLVIPRVGGVWLLFALEPAATITDGTLCPAA